MTSSLSIQRLLPILAAVILGGLLAPALLGQGRRAAGLTASVAERLGESGVANPVTAVLLNFRAYDTLLELVVMLLALMAIWAIAPARPPLLAQPAPALTLLVRLVTPVIVVLAGYLLWIGAYAPGGAFQAGAVLAGVGILLVTAGSRSWPDGGQGHRAGAIVGVSMFLVVGLAVSISGGREFLEYPRGHAKHLILLIESAAMIAIAVTITALYRGGRPAREDPEGG